MYVNQNFKYALSQDLFSSDDVGSWEGPNVPSDAQLCSLFCFHPKVAPGYYALFRPSAESGHKHKRGLISPCMSFTRQRLV